MELLKTTVHINVILVGPFFVFTFYHMLTFIRYNEVNLTFALVDCVRYNEDLNRSRFVKSRFYSVHFTVILTG